MNIRTGISGRYHEDRALLVATILHTIANRILYDGIRASAAPTIAQDIRVVLDGPIDATRNGSRICGPNIRALDRKSTRLNSSHVD